MAAHGKHSSGRGGCADRISQAINRTPMAEIDIALPAYNCAAWLDDLIESILQQDVENWRIIARDDASTDGTAARLAAWKQRLGERMTIVDGSGSGNLGPVGNYNAILSATTSGWIMLADSDDVWRPGKIALTLQAMRTAEAAHGAATPLLVFTDAAVVDEHLQPVAESYWRWSRANLAAARVFHRLIVDSPAISSTMMVNRALIDLALPMPGLIWSQDWWAMMVAAAFGQIVKLDEPTIFYRRHSSNDSLEPYAATTKNMVRRLLVTPGSARKKLDRLIGQIAPQAGAFAERFQHELSASDLAALMAASRLLSAGGFERRWSVLRHGLWFGSLQKNVGLMLLL
jgi:glycosyltransferase involved in cell wall biosynthesis